MLVRRQPPQRLSPPLNPQCRLCARLDGHLCAEVVDQRRSGEEVPQVVGDDQFDPGVGTVGGDRRRHVRRATKLDPWRFVTSRRPRPIRRGGVVGGRQRRQRGRDAVGRLRHRHCVLDDLPQTLEPHRHGCRLGKLDHVPTVPARLEATGRRPVEPKKQPDVRVDIHDVRLGVKFDCPTRQQLSSLLASQRHIQKPTQNL